MAILVSMLKVDAHPERNDNSDSHEEPRERRGSEVPMAMENVMFWTEGFFGGKECMNL